MSPAQNIAKLMRFSNSARTLEQKKQLQYDLRDCCPHLASYGLNGEESRRIDQFFEKEFPNCLDTAQNFKKEGKNDEADAIETAMVEKFTAMVDRIRIMASDKETPKDGSRGQESIEERLWRLEKLAPLLEALPKINEVQRSIDVFFNEELPACREKIQKLRAEGKEDIAKAIEDAMQKKTVIMKKRVQSNKSSN